MTLTEDLHSKKYREIQENYIQTFEITLEILEDVTNIETLTVLMTIPRLSKKIKLAQACPKAIYLGNE